MKRWQDQATNLEFDNTDMLMATKDKVKEIKVEILIENKIGTHRRRKMKKSKFRGCARDRNFS